MKMAKLSTGIDQELKEARGPGVCVCVCVSFSAATYLPLQADLPTTSSLPLSPPFTEYIQLRENSPA